MDNSTSLAEEYYKTLLEKRAMQCVEELLQPRGALDSERLESLAQLYEEVQWDILVTLRMQGAKNQRLEQVHQEYQKMIKWLREGIHESARQIFICQGISALTEQLPQ